MQYQEFVSVTKERPSAHLALVCKGIVKSAITLLGRWLFYAISYLPHLYVRGHTARPQRVFLSFRYKGLDEVDSFSGL